MTSNHVKTAVEFFYLLLMLRWENTARADKHLGYLDGKKTPNSQTARLAFILNKIGSGDEGRTFQAVARFSRRNDGESYISKNSAWMEKPYPLLKGWFLEGGQSLPQKQKITDSFSNLGLSGSFVSCCDDFVAGKSVGRFMPTEDEMRQMIEEAEVRERNYPEEIRSLLKSSTGSFQTTVKSIVSGTKKTTNSQKQ